MKLFENISVKLMHGFFFVLMLMAVLLFKERLFADASYYIFHAINKGWFHVEHGRTVLGISQVLPILGSWLHLPLKLVLILGSLGHELYYYSIFLLCLYPLKDKAGALAVLGIHLIGQLWLYYSPMLEICYGAALAVLFYSILRSGKYKDGKWMVLLLLAQWFAMMSHPENFLLLAVAIAYDMLNKRTFYTYIHGISIAFTALGFLIEVLTFSEYELGHAKVVGEETKASAFNLLNGEYLSGIVELFGTYYYDLMILLLITTVFLAFKKRWLKLGLLLASISALILVVNQAALANEFTRYYESMYSPMVFIIVLFFAYELTQHHHKGLKIAMVSLLLIFTSIRIVWIYDHGSQLRDRTEQWTRIVNYAQELGHSKYIIQEKNITNHNWANSIESLFFSAMDGKENTVSVVTQADMDYNKNYTNLDDSTFVFRMFEVEQLDFLNPVYFQLKPEKYLYLNSNLNKADLPKLKENIKIELLGKEALPKNDSLTVMVRVVNTSGIKIPSFLEDQLYLSYHWKKEDGVVYEWDGVRTPIELDIFERYTQQLRLKTPTFKGTYYLVPDIVIEGEMWFNLEEEYKIEIK